MSFGFYSLVSSIKDKSSQAMATLSSDLKEFTSIVQEDVAEIAKTVQQSVHEQSEARRLRAQSQQQSEGENGDAMATDSSADAASSSTTSSMLSAFRGLSLESVSTTLLHRADELLGALAATGESNEQEDENLAARRFRLLALQEDVDTYVDAPLDVETFHKWRAALSAEELSELQEDVLASYPTVATKLEELVPGTVAVEDFWAHYIYKASLLAAQEKRGADILEHALNDSEEDLSWDVESPTHSSSEQAPSLFGEEDALPQRTASPVVKLVMPAVPSVSSDGSWIELDERQQSQQQQQPPLSTSSSCSFVREPMHSAASDSGSEAAMPIVDLPSETASVDCEDELNWGDEDEDTTTITAAPASGGGTTPQKAGGVHDEPKVRGEDWGEWD